MLDSRPVVWTLLLWMCVLTAASLGARGGVLFRDDFDGTYLDPADWNINHGDPDWVQSRTNFNRAPHVYGGLCTLEHHAYNPRHPGDLFLSTEIWTKAEYARPAPGACLCFEARVRTNPMACGLVTSFFTYKYQNDHTSDEIDYEFLSNQINHPIVPNQKGHQVVVNTWDDSQQSPDNPLVDDLDLNDFNIFRMCWWADHVEWKWKHEEADDWTLIRSTTDCVPDSDMSVYFSFWACDCGWPAACALNLQPADDHYNNIVFSYDIDYMLVEECPEPSTIILLAVGSLCVGGMKRRRQRNVRA